MIHFPHLRGGRLSVRLRELTAGQAVELAAVPPEKNEEATTRMLRYVIEAAEGEHANPALWTVQERMLAMAHYLSATADDGPDFTIGVGRFSDYLDGERDRAPEFVDVGEAAGSQWRAHQVTGEQAACMENLCANRWDWLTADIAVRMRAHDDERPPPPDATQQAGAFVDWLRERMEAVRGMPESDFAELLVLYRLGLDKLAHLFALDVDDQGYIALPRDAGKGGDQGDLVAARFSVDSCLSDIARALGARRGEPGGAR